LSNKTLIDLDKEKHHQAVQLQQEASSQGLRVLALCQRTLHDMKLPVGNQEAFEKLVVEETKSLTLTGLVSIRDPPRPDTLPTVRAMRQAGIRIFMVTGDFELTAVAIAKQ